MRRLTAILMAALMVFALAACGQSSAPAAASDLAPELADPGIDTSPDTEYVATAIVKKD